MSRFVAVISFVLLLTISAELRAQIDPVLNYLPLEVGNSWTYFDVLFPPPDFDPDTTFYGGRGVFAEIVIEDSLYFDTVILPGRWISVDEFGSIWTFIDGVGRTLLMDVTLDDGAVIEYGSDHPIYADYRLTISKGASADTHIGRFENTMTFSFEHTNAVDADFEYTFAPDVGVIEYGGWVGYYYRIYSAYVGGAFVQDVARSDGIPQAFVLHSNYPNPFNPVTTISFSLASPGPIELKVYNILGELVETIENRVLPAGEYRTRFDANGFASGIYFYTLTAGDFSQTRKMVVMK